MQEEDALFDIKQVVVLRDLVDMSTSAIYRFKYGFEVLHPMLKGVILPPSTKANLSAIEGHGNLKIVAVLHLLIVEKDDTKQKLLTHMYFKMPWHLAEILKDKTKMDDKYQGSVTYMNGKHADKGQCTINIDKYGDGIGVSSRYMNRKEGNLAKHTHHVVLTEGPVCKCYENEAHTIFNKEYQTGGFLQCLVDASYLMSTVMIPNHQCQSIMFPPVPTCE